MTVTLWTEIVRILDGEPGLTQEALRSRLNRGAFKHAEIHRLILSGYVHCLVDFGILSRSGRQLYSNGHFGDMVIQYQDFLKQLEEKRQKFDDKLREVRARRLRAMTAVIRDDDTSDLDELLD